LSSGTQLGTRQQLSAWKEILMDESLEVLLRKLNVRIWTKDAAAFEDIEKLAEQYPQEPKVWRTLACAHEAKGDHAAAIAAVTRAMALDAREPGLFLDRGYYALNARDYERAVADCSQGLDLQDEPNWGYYHDVLRMVRAAGFYRLGKKAEALADLSHIRDAYVLWKGELWSKEELAALCGGEAPAGDRNGSPESDKIVLPESPDEEEAALAAKLGEDGLEAVDAALLKHARARYLKAARVIADAINASGVPFDDNHFWLFARRLNLLADAGLLRARGNLHNPRRSEVRLPERP
jgi:tetratricopeptide (TPR) repeat protein